MLEFLALTCPLKNPSYAPAEVLSINIKKDLGNILFYQHAFRNRISLSALYIVFVFVFVFDLYLYIVFVLVFDLLQ